MEMQLSCQLCQDDYSTEKIPRLLTHCGHTFCSSCIDTMITESEDGQYQLACPEDSKIMCIPTNDLKHFPKNITLLRIIEKNAKNLELEFSKINKDDQHEQPECEDEDTKQLINAIKECGNRSHLDESRQRQKEVSPFLTLTAKGESKKQLGRNLSCEHVQDVTPPQRSDSGDQEEEGMCLLHQKVLDVVCMVDLDKICAKCAIFGEHRNHEFKSVEQIEKELHNYYEDIFRIVELKQNAVSSICSESVKKGFMTIVAGKRSKLYKDITERFRILSERVKKAEEKALIKLEEVMQRIQESVKKMLQIDEGLLGEYSKWEAATENHLKIIEGKEFFVKLDTFYKNSHNESVLEKYTSKGQEIIACINIKEENLVPEVERLLQGVSIFANEDTLLEVEKYLTVNARSTSKSNTKLKNKPNSPREGEESLLGEERSMQPSQSAKKIPQFTSSSTFTSSPTNFVIPTTTFLSSQSIPSETLKRNKSSDNLNEKAVDRPSKKKLKMLKVPQKIAVVLESLFNDTLDTLDLTNAQLGDAVILQICEYIRGSKVRNLKLIRNKLTDDVVPKMLPYFSNISNLNLSQNLFTENALVYLTTYRETLPLLRNLVMSQNKIAERKSKPIIEKLRKMDLTVSL